jgi:hypothetical protein
MEELLYASGWCRKSRNYQQSSWSVFDQAKTLSFSAVIKWFICCFMTANCSFVLLIYYGCYFSDWVPLQVVFMLDKFYIYFPKQITTHLTIFSAEIWTEIRAY